MYRITARLAADGKNIVVERQWQIHDDQVGDHNWKTIDRFNTPSLAKVPASKRWIEPVPAAQRICSDEECAECNPHVHFMTDPRCINYKFDEPFVETSGCSYCDRGDPVHVNFGKRQHLADGWDENGQYLARWADCANQQKLLSDGNPLSALNFDNFGDLEIKIIAAATDNLCSNADFISTAIRTATTDCLCKTCVSVRNVVKSIIYGEVETEAV